MVTEKKRFLQFHDLEVEIERTASEDVRRLLEDYLLGTEGGLRYRQLDIRERLAAIGEIWFMSLRKRGRLLGTVGFVRRELACDSTRFNSYYVRYFSIRSSPVRKELKGRNIRTDKQGGRLRTRVEEFMGEAHRYLRGNGRLPSVLYAYIEKENSASLQMSGRMGYHPVRSMDLTWFSRLSPRRHVAVSPACEEDKEMIRVRLRHFYSEHCLFHEEGLFRGGDYYLFRDPSGRVVAGVQTRVVHWQITGMPGAAGFFFLRLLPRIPRLKRFHDGHGFRFLSLEAVFFEKGWEHALIPLVETAMADTGMHLAVLWHDTDDPLRRAVRSLRKRGWFAHLIGTPVAEVRMRFLETTAEQENAFRQRPVYVAAFDVT